MPTKRTSTSGRRDELGAPTNPRPIAAKKLPLGTSKKLAVTVHWSPDGGRPARQLLPPRLCRAVSSYTTFTTPPTGHLPVHGYREACDGEDCESYRRDPLRRSAGMVRDGQAANVEHRASNRDRGQRVAPRIGEQSALPVPDHSPGFGACRASIQRQSPVSSQPEPERLHRVLNCGREHLPDDPIVISAAHR